MKWIKTELNRHIFCFQRKEPDVMFVENREDGTADGAQISFTNNKKVNQISKALIDWLQILGKQNQLSLKA